MKILPTKIVPIRAFKDNYIWMIVDEIANKAFVVDPGDATPVIEALNYSPYTLSGILVTHHHRDHTGGIEDLLSYAGNIPVYGSQLSTNSTISHPVKEGSEVTLSNFKFKVMEIPGHTLDHIAFYIDSILIFSGDTLFSAGCGKIFEGTPEMMFNSLNKISQLNDKTQLYCGHEYTLSNLKFAQLVEPSNSDILNRIERTKMMMESTGCSLPSTLGDERFFNPFLRCAISDVINAAENDARKKLSNPLQVFAYLRNWKNTF